MAGPVSIRRICGGNRKVGGARSTMKIRDDLKSGFLPQSTKVAAPVCAPDQTAESL